MKYLSPAPCERGRKPGVYIAVMAALAALAALIGLAGTATPARAQGSCESIVAQIETRIRASGVSSFSLRTVDVAQPAPGKVVGNCDRGAKKIVYLQTNGPAAAPTSGSGATAAAAAPARPRTAADHPNDGILTECKDGSMSVGGTCGRR